MGNRCNYGFIQEDGNAIVLYSHWGGSSMFANFARALKEVKDCGRADDDAYGTRIAVSVLTQGDYPLGFGLSVNRILDNDHNHVVAYDFRDQTVTLYRMEWEWTLDNPVVTFSLDRFIEKYN